MSVGAFTDKAHPPSERQLVGILGEINTLWNEIRRYVEKNFRVKEEWKYYGTNHGWALRFRKSGKALFSLYPARRSFTVQLILTQTVVKQSQSMKLAKATREAIERAHPYPEGRWVFLNVDSKGKLEDARKLLVLKATGGA